MPDDGKLISTNTFPRLMRIISTKKNRQLAIKKDAKKQRSKQLVQAVVHTC
jgi:hypothetical protein